MEAALGRRLDRLSRQFQRLERDLTVSTETLALFVRFWLTVVPPLPVDAQASAQAKGRERYENFIEALGHRLAKGQTLLREIAQDIGWDVRRRSSQRDRRHRSPPACHLAERDPPKPDCKPNHMWPTRDAYCGTRSFGRRSNCVPRRHPLDPCAQVLLAVAAARKTLLRLYQEGQVHNSHLHQFEKVLDLEEPGAQKAARKGVH